MTATLQTPLLATDCICGRHLFQEANEGTCLLCGHGHPHAVVEHAYARNMQHNTAPMALPARVVPITSARLRWDEDACVVAYREWEARYGRAPTCKDWTHPRALDEPKRPAHTTIYRLFGSWPAFRQYVADVPREARAA